MSLARKFLKKAGIPVNKGYPIEVSQEQLDRLITVLHQTNEKKFYDLSIIYLEKGGKIIIVAMGPEIVTSTQCWVLIQRRKDLPWESMRQEVIRRPPFLVLALG